MAAQTATIRASGSLTPLCWLAGKYGTDKLGFYTPIYDLLLSGRRDRVFRVLEVGIGTPEAMKHVPGYRPGASLCMWRDYFPNAYICGLDVQVPVRWEDSERLTVIRGDSRDPDIVPALLSGGRFDLIVDDGSHEPEDQRKTFENLSPLLVQGGLYIVEDVNEKLYLDVEHTEIHHAADGGVGSAILIRQEALHAV